MRILFLLLIIDCFSNNHQHMFQYSDQWIEFECSRSTMIKYLLRRLNGEFELNKEFITSFTNIRNPIPRYNRSDNYKEYPPVNGLPSMLEDLETKYETFDDIYYYILYRSISNLHNIVVCNYHPADSMYSEIEILIELIRNHIIRACTIYTSDTDINNPFFRKHIDEYVGHFDNHRIFINSLGYAFNRYSYSDIEKYIDIFHRIRTTLNEIQAHLYQPDIPKILYLSKYMDLNLDVLTIIETKYNPEYGNIEYERSGGYNLREVSVTILTAEGCRRIEIG